MRNELTEAIAFEYLESNRCQIPASTAAGRIVAAIVHAGYVITRVPATPTLSADVHPMTKALDYPTKFPIVQRESDDTRHNER